MSVARMLLLNTTAGIVLPVLILWLDNDWSWAELRSSLLYSMIYSHSIGSTVAGAFALLGPMLGRMGPVRAWCAVIAVLIGCSFIGCGIGTALAKLTERGKSRSYSVLFWGAFQFSLPICLVIGVTAGAIEDVRDRLRTTALQLRTKELERERAEKIAAEARLTSLESRVHPHFLFNALNSISALIRENPAAAERLVERLAALLRFSLDSHAGLVPLGKELKIVCDYLEIERARFGDRLAFHIDVPAELHAAQIPAMAIQTLVENSVKYAVAPRREGGTIRVTAQANDAVARIEVRDDGPGLSVADMRQGHGLDLLQSRLQSAFGDSASLSIDASAVIVTVPLRREAAA